MVQEILSYTITVSWLLAVVFLVAAFVGGALFARKFGTNWLAAMRFVLGEEEIATLAILMWEAGLVPKALMRIRFKDDSALFVAWLIKTVRNTWDEQSALYRASQKRGIVRSMTTYSRFLTPEEVGKKPKPLPPPISPDPETMIQTWGVGPG